MPVHSESTENLFSSAGPLYRFDRRCDSVWQHQVRAIQAVQKTKEVALVRFLIPEIDMLVDIRRRCKNRLSFLRIAPLRRDRCSGKQIADVPVVVQSQVPVVQKMQKPVEVPQVHFIDKVNDVPMQRQVQPIDKVVDVPEV